MSFIDVAIPGMIGLFMLVWPQSLFMGSRKTPDAKKIRLLRGTGLLLLLVALLYLVIGLASS